MVDFSLQKISFQGGTSWSHLFFSHVISVFYENPRGVQNERNMQLLVPKRTGPADRISGKQRIVEHVFHHQHVILIARMFGVLLCKKIGETIQTQWFNWKKIFRYTVDGSEIRDQLTSWGKASWNPIIFQRIHRSKRYFEIAKNLVRLPSLPVETSMLRASHFGSIWDWKKPPGNDKWIAQLPCGCFQK